MTRLLHLILKHRIDRDTANTGDQIVISCNESKKVSNEDIIDQSETNM